MRFPSKLASAFALLFLILARSASAQWDPSDPNYEYWYYYVCSVDPYWCSTLPPPGYVPPAAEEQDPEDANRTYFPRFGDINGDGKDDMCITGDATRHVSDFMVVSSGSDYSLVPYASMSGAMHNACQTWPISSTAVSRVSVQGNGYYDFIIDALDGASSILVAMSGAGRTPAHIMNFNDARNETAKQIRGIIEHPQENLAVFDQQYTVLVEWWVQVPDWSCYGMPYDYMYTCPWVWVVYYTYTTVYGADLYYTAEARDFVTQNRDLLQMGRPDQCPVCYREAINEVIAANPHLIRRDWTPDGLSPDDVWMAAMAGVALAGRNQRHPYIVLGAAAAGAGVVALEALQQWNNSHFSDAGPPPGDMAGSTPASPPPPDPDQFDYNTPGEKTRVLPQNDAGHRAAIRDLRYNMQLQGLQVPRGWAAHHMAPFRALKNGIGDQARAILQRHNIPINSAVNGVALPTTKIPGVQALQHSALHSEAAVTELVQRMLQAEAQAIAQGGNAAAQRLAVQRALRQAAKDMSTGDFIF